MKRCVFLTSMCMVWFFLLSWQSLLYPQGESGKTQPKPKAIEGFWTEISYEKEGEIITMLPDPIPRLNAPITGYYLWKISKETIEMGPDRKDRFPMYRYTYKLNPGSQADAIDLNLDAVNLEIADKEKRRKLNANEKKTQPAIYFVSGNYLMICIGRDSRPKSFTTSEDNHNRVHILRRGKLKSTGPASVNQKRKDR